MDNDLVVGGISQLFDRFVLVDFYQDTYEYLNGTIPQFEKIPRKGDYTQLVDFIVSMIVDEREKEFIRKCLAKTSIQEEFRRDISHLQYGYRICRESIQYENLNIICMERDNGVAVKILVTRQDVTEVIDKERRDKEILEKALEEAKEANLAKTRFLSHMSHDIRTPLNAIIGMAEVAQNNIENPTKISDMLEKILLSGEYLLSLVNDVLDMSQIEGGKIALVEEEYLIAKPLNHALPILKEQARKKEQDLVVELKDLKDHYIIGDAHRVEQIILNVVGNAIKFTPPKGKITITMYQGEEVIPGYGNYVFECQDSGPGMTAETIAQITDPFFRASEYVESHIEGTGLGMSIVATMVRLMNGQMEITSKPGEGSLFRISINQKESLRPMSLEANPTIATAPKLTQHNQRVLLVEDNELNVEVASEMFHLLGITADVAKNGKVALDMLSEAEDGRYAMIFMDVMMPVMDGYAATRAIRALERKEVANLPIIAMTANAFVEDVNQALRVGMSDHLAKPIQINKLNECIKKWI